MYQGYGQQPVRAPQNYFSMQPQQTALKGRPVSSLEEVRATGIDFDGSVFYFPDNVDLSIQQEEILADLIATYGQEIVGITNCLNNRIRGTS